jgi:hypothetical protein
MSHHLSDETLADALTGARDAAALAHLRSCASCAGRLAEAEEGLALARLDEVPEPSPFYWAALRRDVRRRTAAEPRRSGWRVWLAPVAVAAGLAAIVLVRGPLRAPAVNLPVAGPTTSPALPAWSALPPIDEDGAVPVLEGLVAVVGPGWDEGMGPDAYVVGLSDADQAALAAALAPGNGRGEEL